jgi:hypothetical protein
MLACECPAKGPINSTAWPAAAQGSDGDRVGNRPGAQNRDSMRAGKFSGFHSFTQEDALVVLSAGPIKDRLKEGRGLLDRFQYLPWKVLSCAFKSNLFETFEGSTRTLSAHPLGRHLRQIVAIGSRRSTKQGGHRLDVFRQ